MKTGCSYMKHRICFFPDRSLLVRRESLFVGSRQCKHETQRELFDYRDPRCSRRLSLNDDIPNVLHVDLHEMLPTITHDAESIVDCALLQSINQNEFVDSAIIHCMVTVSQRLRGTV